MFLVSLWTSFKKMLRQVKKEVDTISKKPQAIFPKVICYFGVIVHPTKTEATERSASFYFPAEQNECSTFKNYNISNFKNIC